MPTVHGQTILPVESRVVQLGWTSGVGSQVEAQGSDNRRSRPRRIVGTYIGKAQCRRRSGVMRYILQGRAAVSGEDELVDHRGAEGVQPSDRPELGANGRVKARANGYVAAG